MTVSSNDPRLEDIVELIRASHGRQRVVPVEWMGQRCWLKQAGGDDGIRFLNRLHRGLSPLLPDLLKNVQGQDERSAIRAEAERLRDWNAKGLPAPQLLASGDDWMITKDAGDWIIHRIQAADKDKAAALVAATLEVLLKVHAAKTAHGRPMIKDMAIDRDGNISILDLEENTVAAMPLPAAQARDLWIYLASATRYVGPSEIDNLVTRALSQAGTATIAEMRKSLKTLLCVKKLTAWIGAKRLGREISGAFLLADSLQSVLKYYE